MSRSLTQGSKRFYCREWAFAKIHHCLETRQTSKTCGALIMGGPGSGKTVLCSEIAWPTSNHGRQKVLKRRLLAHHFCQAHDLDTLSVVKFIHSLVAQLSSSELVPGYAIKVQEPEVVAALEDGECDSRPDEAFKKAILFPLLELDPPKQACFILVDSIDETYLQAAELTDRVSLSAAVSAAAASFSSRSMICESSNGVASGRSTTIAELLANHHQLFPQWLLLFCSSRKQSKPVNKLFTGFRKISLDDLHKTHVVRDVQQYILSRLDQEESLRQHLSRETAEMLNQLHIKSNGCFLYLETVLNGVIDSFIVLREIREIPGTLNGLYLWLCQRLFSRKNFAKVQPVLNVLLAARRPVAIDDLYTCVKIRLSSTSFAFTKEEFNRRLNMLSKLILDGHKETCTSKILFHHSFAEWLVDVKHCTQKYLCNPLEGHTLLAMCYTLRAAELKPPEVRDFAWHLSRVVLDKPWEQSLLPLWMVYSGARTEDVNLLWSPERNQKTSWLLMEAGAISQVPRHSDALPSSLATSQEEALSLGDDNISNEKAEGADKDLEQQEGRELDAVEELLATGVSLSSVDANQRTLLHNAVYDNDARLASLLISRGLIDLEKADKNGQTALNLAARQGNTECVRLLLEAKADANHADNEGWTPLRSSAWGGHTHVVSALLEHGASVDLADADQRTALRAAAWGGHEEIVGQLLEYKACVNLVDAEGRTALIAAAYMGHGEIVDHLLKNGAHVNHQDRDGRTALSVASLCVAASQGHSRVVDILLENGAEVNHRDNDGMTPLLVAAFEGHKEVCEMLLEYDADADHVDRNGRSPLLAAASMGHAEIVNLLLFFGAAIDAIDAEGRTVLSVAASQGNVDVVRQLLDRGMDEMHKCNSGWTPLHYASFEGHKEVCEALLEAGARVNEVDNDGKHAIILAAQEGHLSAVVALVDGGAIVDHRSHDGRTAFRVACLEGHGDVVTFLLERGADANYIDADGRSTLYLLALENHLTVASFLLEFGVDVETMDLEGRTPLHVACWQNHLKMVELLLDGEALVDATDLDRRTSLQLAAWQGHVEVVKKLLERDAKVDHTCNQGATALCIAAQEGHEDVVRILLECGADVGHADQFGRSPARVASKCGHTNVVRLLEEYGGSCTGGAGTGGNSSGNSSSATTRSPSGCGFPGSNSTTSMVSCTSTAETKPCNAILCPPGFNTPAALSPGSTYEKRRSCCASDPSSTSKSSGNMTTSTKSSQASKVGPANACASLEPLHIPLAINPSQISLSFTQQLQQCTRLRNRPLSRLLSPLSEPQTPVAGTPEKMSPTNGAGPAAPGFHCLSPLANSSSPRPAAPAAASGAVEYYHSSFSPWIDGGSSTTSGAAQLLPTAAAASLLSPSSSTAYSPEAKLRRNGIVTNPNYKGGSGVGASPNLGLLASKGVLGLQGSAANGKQLQMMPNVQMARKQHLKTIASTCDDQAQMQSRPIGNAPPLKKETPL